MISEEVEPMQKKKMKTSQSISFSSLPDDIAENCLSRISSWKYPLLSLVSKTFYSFLSSPQIFTTRSHLGTTEPCLYICVKSPNNSSPQWFALWMKPEEGLTDDDEIFDDYSLFPIHSSSPSPPVSRYSTIAVGYEIYVIGGLTTPSSSVRILDCRSHTWHDAPSMTVARTRAKSVLLDQNIYVMGGCGKSDNWFEVFDIKTQTWSVLPSPIADHDELRRLSMVYDLQGKLHVVSERIMEYTYEPKSGTWEVVGEESYRCMDVTVIQNVVYRCFKKECLMWYDYEARKWKDINGLENLGQYLTLTWVVPRLVNYGGKLVVMWRQTVGQDFVNGDTEIWCAKIALEKRVGGEIWGEIEWLNTVLTVPGCYLCFNCAVVSI